MESEKKLLLQCKAVLSKSNYPSTDVMDDKQLYDMMFKDCKNKMLLVTWALQQIKPSTTLDFPDEGSIVTIMENMGLVPLNQGWHFLKGTISPTLQLQRWQLIFRAVAAMKNPPGDIQAELTKLAEDINGNVLERLQKQRTKSTSKQTISKSESLTDFADLTEWLNSIKNELQFNNEEQDKMQVVERTENESEETQTNSVDQYCQLRIELENGLKTFKKKYLESGLKSPAPASIVEINPSLVTNIINGSDMLLQVIADSKEVDSVLDNVQSESNSI